MRGRDSSSTLFMGGLFSGIAQAGGSRNADQIGFGFEMFLHRLQGFWFPIGGILGVGGFDLVQLSAERQNMEQCVEQCVAIFLHDIGGTGIAHEGRAGGAADDRTWEGRGDIHAAPRTCAR